MKSQLAVATENAVHFMKAGSEPTLFVMFHTGLMGHNVRCVTTLPGEVYAGTRGAFVFGCKDGENWEALLEGIKFPHVESIAPHASLPNTLLCGTSPPAVFRSDDRGQNWTEVPGLNDVPGAANWTYPPPTYMARVRSVVTHPQQTDLVMAGIQVGGVAATLGAGQDWADRHTGLPRDLRCLVQPKGAPTRLYAGTESNFFRSDDLGETWNLSSKGIPYPFIEDIAVDPNNPDRLMLVTHRAREGPGAAIFTSQNGGQNWDICAKGVTNLERCRVTTMAGNGEEFFFGTDSGDLYGSTNFGEFWACLKTGLRGINDLAVIDFDFG